MRLVPSGKIAFELITLRRTAFVHSILKIGGKRKLKQLSNAEIGMLGI